MSARMSRILPVMMLAILGVVSTPWPGGVAIAGPEAMMKNLTKDDVRIELRVNLPTEVNEQYRNIRRIYERANLEFIRNGWRNEDSGRYVGAVILGYETREKGGVVHVEVRIREAGTDTIYNGSKPDALLWEDWTVRLMENCIGDAGYWN